MWLANLDGIVAGSGARPSEVATNTQTIRGGGCAVEFRSRVIQACVQETSTRYLRVWPRAVSNQTRKLVNS